MNNMLVTLKKFKRAKCVFAHIESQSPEDCGTLRLQAGPITLVWKAMNLMEEFAVPFLPSMPVNDHVRWTDDELEATSGLGS